MLRQRKYFLILAACVLTSCSTIYGPHGFIQNRSKDYLEATNIPPLRIPPGLSSSTIQQHYPVSERQYPEECKEVKLLPPNLSSAAKVDDKQLVNNITPANHSKSLVKEATATSNQASHIEKRALETNANEQVLKEKTALVDEEILTKKAVPGTKAKKPSILPNPMKQGFTAPIADPAITPKQQAQAESHYYDPHTRSSTGGVGKSIVAVINKIWPWGHKSEQQNTSEKSELSGKQVTENTSVSKPLTELDSKSTIFTTNANPANDSSQPSAQTGKMPNMYFDRYTRR